MSRQGGPGPSGPPKPAVISSQEFVVRIPKATKRRHHVMRFMQGRKQTSLEWNQVRMERENNLKEYRTETDDMPKFGAGSEYGRELKDEARRKKFGIVRKKYNPDDQPWHLRIGGRQGKKFKGIREGGVMENASYYVFSKAPDGIFEAYPVDEWYNFTPIQTYKALTAEEAEDAYSQRDKIINHFAIMVKKRLAEAQGQNFEEDKDGSNSKDATKGASKKSRASLKLSDIDDWVGDSDFSGAESNADDGDEDPAKKKKKRKDQKKKDKKSQESDSSAREESDEGDFDDREVDYMTSGSESSGEEPEDEKVNKQMKGVEDEDALRQLVLSDEDEEEENENKKEEDEENKNDEDGDKANGDGKNKDGEKSSSADKDSAKGGGINKVSAGAKSSDESSSENSDSDLDDSQLLGSSAVFMQGKRKDGGSRSGTPTKDVNNGTSGLSKKNKNSGSQLKRKKEGTPTKEGAAGSAQTSVQHGSQQSHLPTAGSEPTSKKPKIELNLGINLNNSTATSNNNSNSNSTLVAAGASGLRGNADNAPLAQIEGINEEAVRRYLMRKPMTTTELLQKFKSKKTGLSSDQLVNTIAQILKRLNPEKQKIKDKLYLSIKQ